MTNTRFAITWPRRTEPRIANKRLTSSLSHQEVCDQSIVADPS